MDGSLTRNNRRLLAINTQLLSDYQSVLTDLNVQTDEQLSEFDDLHHHLQAIPEISQRIAQIIITEVGPDVSPFPDTHHLAPWAGLCPGIYESTGVKHGSHILHSNVYLKSDLISAALAAEQIKESGLKDYFYRLRSRMGGQLDTCVFGGKLPIHRDSFLITLSTPVSQFLVQFSNCWNPLI